MGMTLYDIDAQIAALDGAAEDDMLIDAETGELISVSQALDALRMEREDGTTDKLKTGRVMVSVKKNPPSTVVDDEALLPWKYKTVKEIVAQDKAAIKSAILAGEDVPGAHLEYGRSVVIK